MGDTSSLIVRLHHAPDDAALALFRDELAPFFDLPEGEGIRPGQDTGWSDQTCGVADEIAGVLSDTGCVFTVEQAAVYEYPGAILRFVPALGLHDAVAGVDSACVRTGEVRWLLALDDPAWAGMTDAEELARLRLIREKIATLIGCQWEDVISVLQRNAETDLAAEQSATSPAVAR